MEENIYTIYAHINKINGKTYIGQTKQKLSRRFRKDGEGYSRCIDFFDAIKNEGWDNFKHIVLFENLTIEQADLIEEYLIEKFDLRNPKKGYNMAKGGHGLPIIAGKIISEKNKENWKNGIYDSVKNKVYCVELKHSFDSVLEAERQTGVDNSAIQKVCKGNLKYAGFSPEGKPLHWIFESEKTDEKIKELYYKEEILKGVSIPVYCPELNIIFKSTTDAYNQYHIDPSSIRKVIKGVQKTTGKHPISGEPLHWEEKPELINTKNKLSQEKWNLLLNT